MHAYKLTTTRFGPERLAAKANDVAFSIDPHVPLPTRARSHGKRRQGERHGVMREPQRARVEIAQDVAVPHEDRTVAKQRPSMAESACGPQQRRLGRQAYALPYRPLVNVAGAMVHIRDNRAAEQPHTRENVSERRLVPHGHHRLRARIRKRSEARTDARAKQKGTAGAH
jgi:hypothetical protein